MTPDVGLYINATSSRSGDFGPAVKKFLSEHQEFNPDDLARTGFVAKKPNGKVTEIIPLGNPSLKPTVVADARKEKSVWFLVNGLGGNSKQHSGALEATRVREGHKDTGHS